jgi:hypothetical protein
MYIKSSPVPGQSPYCNAFRLGTGLIPDWAEEALRQNRAFSAERGEWVVVEANGRVNVLTDAVFSKRWKYLHWVSIVERGIATCEELGKEEKIYEKLRGFV